MASYCRQMEQKYSLQQVLSPRKFLFEEMRQIPRLDSRKEAMKNDVRECLISSKNYKEFETFMKHKSYQVIKGRGIAFIDKKGVYAKGSELGYSLVKIEKILELSVQQKQALFIKPSQHTLLHKQVIKLKETPTKTLSKQEPANTSIQMNRVIEDLLKPMQSNQNLPFQLLKKNKKRKRSQHL